MRRFAPLLTLVAMALLVGIVPALGSAATATNAASVLAGTSSRGGRATPLPYTPKKPLGISRPKHLQAQSPLAPPGNLTYHNGPVMHTNKTYAIFWVPTGYVFPGGPSESPNYHSLITQFFTDVAADDGKVTNVYFSDTQYFDNTNGNILYNSAFVHAVVDTNPYPSPANCANYVTGGGQTTSACLTDADEQTEILNVLNSQGWVPDATSIFFLFTPDGVGSTVVFSGTTNSAFVQYCAYHSSFGVLIGGVTPANVFYANQPYAAFDVGCDPGERPNGDDADATINVVSHEHN